LLLSGGIDSPVAGWLAAKRGLAQEALTFHSPPFTGEKAKDKVIALARQLSRWQAMSTLWIAVSLKRRSACALPAGPSWR